MFVKKVFVNTYRYDFHLAKICIGSIRYWYPEIPILLIKDINAGNFDTSFLEKTWNVKVLETPGKKFGWGYGKLEPLFLDDRDSFLVVDADTVLTGPVIDAVKEINAQFIVDNEVQPPERVNQIYYDLDRVNEIEEDFIYPGYTFNSGQWFGTSGILSRKDFDKVLDWTEPPSSRFPDMIFNGDQGHLNFILQWLEQSAKISIERMKLMIWPDAGRADFIDIQDIKTKKGRSPFIIHWAGMGSKKISDFPRADILFFYERFYYSRIGSLRPFFDRINSKYLTQERKFRLLNKRLVNLFESK